MCFLAGECFCKEHYHDINCALDIRVPPRQIGIPDLGMCDLNARECAITSVFGFGFVNTERLSCRLIPFLVSKAIWLINVFGVLNTMYLFDFT